MKDFELAQQNLNHLVVLWAILERGGVTQAAEALGRSQSAVSHILAQLRQTFSDPLLVRVSGRWEPTPLATRLGAELGPALLHLHDAVHAVSFAPETSTRDVTMLGPDHLTSAVLEAALPGLRSAAPGIELRVREATTGCLDALVRGDTDLVVVAHATERAGLHALPLWVDTHMCLAPTEALREDGGLGLAAYCQLPHIVAGDDAFVDDALAALGRARKVAVRVPFVRGAVALLGGLPGHIVTLPERACPNIPPQGFALVRPPLVLPTRSVRLMWHQRHHMDPGHRWIREALFEAVQGETT